jgi:hypothetical protein
VSATLKEIYNMTNGGTPNKECHRLYLNDNDCYPDPEDNGFGSFALDVCSEYPYVPADMASTTDLICAEIAVQSTPITPLLYLAISALCLFFCAASCVRQRRTHENSQNREAHGEENRSESQLRLVP